MKNKIKGIITFLLILIAVIMTIGGIYYKINYSEQEFEQIIFYICSGITHTSPAVTESIIKSCLRPVILITLILWLPTSKLVKEEKYVNVITKKSERKLQVYPIPFIRNHRKLYLSILYLIAITTFIIGFGIHKYIANRFIKTTIYEEYYVKAEDVNITFPDNKRNLIIIITESMENSLCSKENGGGWEYSVIPELEQIAIENINFSNTEKIGGADQVSGTTFTAGGMVAITSGNVLKIRNPIII